MGDGFRPNIEFEVRLREQGDDEYGGGAEADDDIDNEDTRIIDGHKITFYKRGAAPAPVGRSGLETLRALAAFPNHAASLLDHYTAASYSQDERVRCEVLEYVPPLALFLSEEGNNGDLRSLITTHLLPTVTRALADENSQVIKMAESALLSLLEHCLISSDYIEHQVWPAIQSRISRRQNVDGTIGVITLVSKMAPWVGQDLSERLIVPLLEEMSMESELGVRRVCASLYRDLCSVVSTEVSESRLVPSFLKLCCDTEWVVRQTCAEVFMSVSCKVTLATRKTLLAPAFAKLLVDRVRWVQLSAFQSLGPFITTFAEPSITSLGYNNNGELVLKHQGASFEYKLHPAKTDGNLDLLMDSMIPSDLPDVKRSNNKFNEVFNTVVTDLQEPVKHQEIKTEIYQVDEEKYNTWQFWRDPVPEISEVDIEPEEYKSKTQESCTDEEWWSIVNGTEEEFVSSILQELKITTSKKPASEVPDESQTLNEEVQKPVSSSESQNIVPQELIDHFVSMSDPSKDCATDLATHCAYNLPAVALTLGKDNWDLLKPAYTSLAADRQWKVRRIVACSIHELAVIVGEDVATQDLVPIFNGFIKDLDEVRIGALKHLAHFLKLLRPAGRNSFLPRLTEFLMTDYDWNWRFRQELAEQLLQSLGLFSPADTCHHLGPVIMALLLDKVASVRKVALVLVTELVSHVSIDVNLLRSLLAELAEQFAHSPRWNRRQTFALLCSRLVKERVLSEEMFARDVLPHLLDLSWDPVANVRLAVARAAAQNILPNPYFANESSPHHEVLVSVLKRLQADKDRDVRYFATYHPPPSQTDSQEEDISVPH